MPEAALESQKRDLRAAAEDRQVLGSLRESHGLYLRGRRRKNYPRVLVVTRRTIRKKKYVDYVGEYHLELLVKLGLLPVIVPVVEGTPAFVEQFAKPLHGLLLVEGEDVEPKHFKT